MARTEGRFSGPSSAQPTLTWSVVGKGMCSGCSEMANLSFPAHFLCYFLLALKESKEIKTRTAQRDEFGNAK
jgi:hypothetical protein